MNTQYVAKDHGRPSARDDSRERLLAWMPVSEQRLQLAGVSTGPAGPWHEQPEAFPEALRAALDSARLLEQRSNP